MDTGIKLIIWDLDGIIWSESLAESSLPGLINQNVIDFIKNSESNGIIHSISSKNEFIKAQKELEKLNIWNYFVFPKIDYNPKGPSVKNIIKECNLREENVLFVDDNYINLNEVKFYCPEVNVTNNTDFIKTFRIIFGKSRTYQYKILENKNKEKFNKSNIDFLKESNINIAFYKCIGLSTGLEYYERVKELVNRSNQLNFTKSRINESNDMPYANFQNSQKYFVFVWDKYGYYGLVGFFATEQDDNWKTVKHFVFSCRIMNMTIENYCSQYIRNNLGWIQNFEIENNGNYAYIKLHDYKNCENWIRENEALPIISEEPKVIIDAGCQTGILSGFSKLDHIIKHVDIPFEYDEIFFKSLPNLIIYSISKFLTADNKNILLHIEKLYKSITKENKKILLLIPKIKNFINDSQLHVFTYCCSSIDNVNIYGLYINIEQDDFMHWNRKTLYDVSREIKNWVEIQTS